MEHPDLWPGVHNRLIAALDEDLSPRLLPRYYVAVKERVYIAEPPDLAFVGRPDAAVVAVRPRRDGREAAPANDAAGSAVQILTATVPVPDRIRETYLEVREAATGEVITVIEVLSPTNKRPGEGRREYEAKRLRTLATLTHLVEIDLLRAGTPMPVRLVAPAGTVAPPGDYRIVVARGDRRPLAEVYVFGVRDPIPSFPLPLRPGDEEPLVDLQRLLTIIYDRSGYALRLDYGAPPVPPLSAEDAAWADTLLHERGH